MNSYCTYYQATITRRDVLYMVSILKSFDHFCFDRTIDVQNSIFEFFVPPLHAPQFEKLMSQFEKEGIVQDLKKLPNRIEMGEKL